MPRIAGVNIPENKRIEIALTYIYGIGRVLSNKILRELKINRNIRAKDLSSDQIAVIQRAIDQNYQVEGNLRQLVKTNIKRLKDVRCYRGIRHIKGLPARGQRTKTNSRTVRGNKRMNVGSGRKKAEKK